MVNGNKVVKNALWIIGCRIAQSLIAIVINMLTARYLGPSNFGIINYAASLITFVTPIMNLGINNILVSELVRCPDEEGGILGTSTVMTFFSSLACIVSVCIFVSYANAGEKETLIVCGLYSLLLIAQSVEIVRYWFQAKLMSKYSSLATLSAYFVVAAYKVWLLATGKSVYWFAISNAFDYLLIAIILLIIYKRKNGKKLYFAKNIAKRILNQSWHYILPGMLGGILAQSDRVMLKMMCGNEAVGLYSASYTIATLSSFIVSAIIDSMRPRILAYKGTDDKEYKKNVSRLFGIIIYISLIQSVIITLFSKLIISVMYGADYMNAVPTLRIIIWYTGFAYFGAVRNVWILAEEKQKFLWITSLAGVVANLILNYIMIPKWGIDGAAFATFITQMISNFAINWVIKPYKKVNKLAFKGLNLGKIASVTK